MTFGRRPNQWKPPRKLAGILASWGPTFVFKSFVICIAVINVHTFHAAYGQEQEGWNLVTEHQKEIGFHAREGIDSQRENYRPLRKVFLGSRGKATKDTFSLHWNLKWSGNRNLSPSSSGKRPPDEIYYPRRRVLTNGTVLDQNQQFLVREAYLQWLEEGWLLQTGAIRYGWGTADFVNPVSVVNPKDLRYGLSAEKDQQLLSTPSLRLTRLLDERSMTLVLIPLQESTLFPSAEHNWDLELDNQRFRTQTIQDEKSRNVGSVALKYDVTIPSGDLSFIYYNGTDHELAVRPESLTIEDRRPLVINLKQLSVRKNSWGAAYQQTFDGIVLKAESLYTPDKTAPKTFDRSRIETLEFPLETMTTPHVASSFGFNYFLETRDFLGIKLSETIFTGEYFAQRFLKSGVLPGLTNEMIGANLRTGAMEDRLEVLATFLYDRLLNGQGKLLKVTFADDAIKHSLNLGQFDGPLPAGDAIGSAFYYFRSRDYAAYELSYSLP